MLIFSLITILDGKKNKVKWADNEVLNSVEENNEEIYTSCLDDLSNENDKKIQIDDLKMAKRKGLSIKDKENLGNTELLSNLYFVFWLLLDNTFNLLLLL